MNKSDCLTRHEIERWLAIQEDDTLYCPHCRGILIELKFGLICQNSMCLFKEVIGISEGNEAEWKQFAEGFPRHLVERYSKILGG